MRACGRGLVWMRGQTSIRADWRRMQGCVGWGVSVGYEAAQGKNDEEGDGAKAKCEGYLYAGSCWFWSWDVCGGMLERDCGWLKLEASERGRDCRCEGAVNMRRLSKCGR